MYGQRELFEAIRCKNVETVANLVLQEKRYNINCRDNDYPSQPTPLIVAAEINALPIVAVLLKARANVDDEDLFGKRPIWWAVKHANIEMTKLLIKYRSKVNYLDKESGCSPLYLAIIKSNAPLAQILVHGGADVNLRQLGMDALCESPMIKAVQLGNVDIVKLLINCMADMNSRTKDGITALHYAVAYRRYDILEVLLQARVKMYLASKHGVTAMTVAVEHDIPYMIRLLMEFGYDASKSFRWGETPLEQAISLHCSNAALALIVNGVSIQRRREKPIYSYFEAAVKNNLLSVARLLLLVRPVFSQERWLREGRIPISLYRQPKFRAWLEDRSARVWPLQELCRAAIFHHLGRYPFDKVERLKKRLPQPLCRYLLFAEAVDVSKLYERLSVQTRECPVDCTIGCPLRRCPEIEVVEEAELVLPPLPRE